MNTAIIENEEIKNDICAYLNSELEAAISELSPMYDKWNEWRRQRESEPKEQHKDFPWDGASNVSVPLADTNTKTIFSSMKAAFGNRKPFFHVASRQLQHKEDAECIQDAVNYYVESKFHVDLRSVNNTIFYEQSSMGIQFVHIPWVVDQHTFKRREEDGSIQQVTITRKDSPGVIPYAPEDVLYRTANTSIQKAPWIGFRNLLTEQELRQRKVFGTYDDVDLILGDETDNTHDSVKELEQRIGMESTESLPYEIFEIYMYWDIDGDDLMEDIKVWYERKHNVLLRAEYNNLGVRPIECFVYLPYTWKETAGRGVGQMCSGMQDAADALFNGAINSSFISSLQMFVTPEDSTLGPNEEFYPFKQIKVPNPQDFQPISFPNTTLPNLQMLRVIQELVDRSTGATNAASGFPDTYAKSRATASGTMFLAQQGGKMFNSIIERTKESFSKVGAFILFQMVQNKDRLKFETFDMNKQEKIKALLNIPPEDLPHRFKFTVITTEADQTEEAKRQRLLTMSQLYSMYGQQMLKLLMNLLQVAGQFAKPLMGEVLKKVQEFTMTLVHGGTKLMENILEEFETAPDGYLPNVRDIQVMLEMINQMRENQYEQRRVGLANQGMQQENVPTGSSGSSQLSNQSNLPPGNGTGDY